MSKYQEAQAVKQKLNHQTYKIQKAYFLLFNKKRQISEFRLKIREKVLGIAQL
jgi:hypothetical protein